MVKVFLLALLASTLSSLCATEMEAITETNDGITCSEYKTFWTNTNGVVVSQEKDKANPENSNCIILNVPNVGDCYVKGYTVCPANSSSTDLDETTHVSYTKTSFGYLKNPISGAQLEFEYCKRHEYKTYHQGPWNK